LILIGGFGEIVVEEMLHSLIVYNVKALKSTPKSFWRRAVEEERAEDYTVLVYLYSALIAGKLPKSWVRLLVWLLKEKFHVNNRLPEVKITQEEKERYESLRQTLNRIKKEVKEPVVVEFDFWNGTIKGRVPLRKVIEP